MLVLGGLPSYWGVAAGAIILWTILEGTRFIDLPDQRTRRPARLRFAIVGLVLILLMAFRPQGLFGKRRRWCSVTERREPSSRAADGRSFEAEGVVKRFGGIHAVDGATLEVARARSRR